MKKKVITFILLCFPLSVPAQQNTVLQAKAVLCAACHGQQGNSTNPAWPNIASQHPNYFMKQIKDMKDSKLVRPVPQMSGLVAVLSEQEMQDLAAYYAKMPLAQARTDEKSLQRGEQIYREGDFSRQITACIMCHGPDGRGSAESGFPVLSAQHALYTVVQLNAFKKGMRKNDLNHIMHDISNKMSQNDMEAVAHYIESLNFKP